MKKQDILENQANIIYLSLGSNLGNRIINLQNSIYFLNEYGVRTIKLSSIYETNSWPNENFPKFLNMVIKCSTKKTCEDLFLTVKEIEKKIGRKNGPKNSPRVCDIDILDFSNKIIKKKVNNHNLTVPHPRMHLRNFVLIPFHEILKNWKHPKIKLKLTKLLLKLNSDNLSSIKII